MHRASRRGQNMQKKITFFKKILFALSFVFYFLLLANTASSYENGALFRTDTNSVSTSTSDGSSQIQSTSDSSSGDGSLVSPLASPPSTTDTDTSQTSTEDKTTASSTLNVGPSSTTEDGAIEDLRDRNTSTLEIQTETNKSLDAIASEIDQTLQTTLASSTVSDSTRTEINASVNEVKENLINDVRIDIEHALEDTSELRTPEIDIKKIEQNVETSFKEIERIVKEKTNGTISTEQNKKDIVAYVEKLNDVIKKYAVEGRQKDSLSAYRDQDRDGISDFDERYIYGTDPKNATTTPGELTDAEKVLKGIDPLSTTSALMIYDDPHERGKVAPDLFSIKNIEIVDLSETDHKGKIQMSGRALPNSFVTIFIYSTPVIVTVKTNFSGEWTYTLEKELADGSHELYTAMVDNSGKIVAKSRPFFFIKEARAITTTADAGWQPAVEDMGFLYNHYKLVLSFVVLLTILAAITASGGFILAERRRLTLGSLFDPTLPETPPQTETPSQTGAPPQTP